MILLSLSPRTLMQDVPKAWCIEHVYFTLTRYKTIYLDIWSSLFAIITSKPRIWHIFWKFIHGKNSIVSRIQLRRWLWNGSMRWWYRIHPLENETNNIGIKRLNKNHGRLSGTRLKRVVSSWLKMETMGMEMKEPGTGQNYASYQ